jgi:DNA-binding transcriptional LysR family regulator
MDPLETRELRYFITLAEELHFGRAAERLGMAQPPLSRSIRQLERRLGVTLFERTSRAVRLTPAGAVLLAEGRSALDALAAAARRAQRAGQDEPRLVLAMKASAGIWSRASWPSTRPSPTRSRSTSSSASAPGPTWSATAAPTSPCCTARRTT